MELTHIEHIGIAVKNLEEAIKYYEESYNLAFERNMKVFLG